MRDNIRILDLKNKKDNKQIDNSLSVFSLAWDLGYLITIPIVALALLGRWIDKKYDSAPWFLLLGIGLSIFISTYLVYKKTMNIIEKDK